VTDRRGFLGALGAVAAAPLVDRRSLSAGAVVPAGEVLRVRYRARDGWITESGQLISREDAAPLLRTVAHLRAIRKLW
jgi:hypothetical protein